MKSNLLAIAALFGVLAGCASFENVTVEQVRTEENFYKTEIIPMSLDEILASKEAYENRCRATIPIVRSVVDPNIAFTQVSQPGWTEMSVLLYMEWEQLPSGQETAVDIWTYYKSWQRKDGIVDDDLLSIQNLSDC